MCDYFVVVVEDCCATYLEEEQYASLHEPRTYFGGVVSVQTFGNRLVRSRQCFGSGLPSPMLSGPLALGTCRVT